MRDSDYEAIRLARERQPERVSAASARAYRQDLRRLAGRGALPEEAAGCLRTYHRYVAALTYWAATRVLGLTAAAVRDALAPGEAEEFEVCANVLRNYPPADPDVPPSLDPRRQQARTPDLPRRGDRSKNAVARRLARSQRERRGAMFRAAIRQNIAPRAVALVRVTGAMPAEVEQGVQLQRIDDTLRITVWGAKQNADRGTGQAWRFCDLALDSPETRYLAGAVPGDGDTITVRCSRRELYRAVRQAAIQGLGRRLGRHVTPYVFRHRVTAAMRPQLTRLELAQFRGDSSSRTAAEYLGSGRGHGARTPTVLLVDAKTPVRRHAAAPVPGVTFQPSTATAEPAPPRRGIRA